MELKEVMNVMQVSGERIPSGYYKKPEVDAVIAEKDAEIAELNDKLRHYPMMVALLESDKREIAELKAQKAQAEDDCAYWKTKAQRERHHKYKRCLAMAKWCEAEAQKCLTQQGAMIGFPLTDRFQYLQWQFTHYSRWRKRWLELAENFKEAR